LYFQQIYGSKHSFLPIILRTLYFKENPYCPLRPLRGHLSQRERQGVGANFEQSDKLKFAGWVGLCDGWGVLRLRGEMGKGRILQKSALKIEKYVV
ncbi:MAG: hypothetical protein IKT58_02735, partial [Oscillospiraceae bacterium]|nr:hypothetical protein [Oscillospiraceae bacterium]